MDVTNVNKIILLLLVCLISCNGSKDVVIENANNLELKIKGKDIIIFNSSSDKISKFNITDGERIYSIGSLTNKDLLENIKRQYHDQIPGYYRIYHYISQAFSHYCSNGTQKTHGTLISRLYSFSFGACSDVNDPILSNLLFLSGYNVKVLSSEHHVATQIYEDEIIYLDSDNKFTVRGDISETDYLSFSNRVFKKNSFKIRKPKVYNNFLNDVKLSLYPNDFITFTNKSLLEKNILKRVQQKQPFVNNGQDKIGYAQVSLDQYVSCGLDQLKKIKVQLPYYLLSASIKSIADQSIILFINDSIMTGYKKIDITRYVKGTDHFTCYTYGSNKLKLVMRFQYNNKIFPKKRKNIKLGDIIKEQKTNNKKQLTIMYRKINSKHELYGTCMSDVTVFGYSIKRIECKNNKWTWMFDKFDVSRNYFIGKKEIRIGVSSFDEMKRPTTGSIKLSTSDILD